MIHSSYRRLDEPPKLAGFSFLQWLGLLGWGSAVAGLEHLLAVPTQPAISLLTLLVGGPAALVYFSESGRPTLLRLVCDLARWCVKPRVYEPGAEIPRPALVCDEWGTRPRPKTVSRRGRRAESR